MAFFLLSAELSAWSQKRLATCLHSTPECELAAHSAAVAARSAGCVGVPAGLVRQNRIRPASLAAASVAAAAGVDLTVSASSSSKANQFKISEFTSRHTRSLFHSGIWLLSIYSGHACSTLSQPSCSDSPSDHI